MAETSARRTLVWSLDAFEEPGGPWVHAVEAIRRIQERSSWSVQPVHVLSPAELGLSAEFAGPWVTQYLPSAREAIGRLLASPELQELKNVNEPEIITQAAASTSRAADRLITYAESIGAEMIVLGTHGRGGLSRWLLGSFAETLLLRSRVPVMVAGPEARARGSLEHVLFPTGFDEIAEAVFRRVVGMAREFGSKITLYHAVPRPIEPLFQSGIYMMGTPWVPVREYYERVLARHRHHVDSWSEWARHQGVETESVLDTDTIDVAKSILRIARLRGAGLIAMAAYNGPLAAFLGGIANQVVRRAECPVWVIRPEALSERDAA